MFKGTITFNADFTGVQFESIEFSDPDSKLFLATVKSAKNEGVILKVEIINVDSVQQIFSQAQEVADYTTKILTFTFNTLFQRFRKVDENIVQEEEQAGGTKQTIIYAFLGTGMGINVDLDHIATNRQLSEVKQLLEKRTYQEFAYYNLFYSALNFKDAMSKFMALYSIALSLCGDSQEKVDQCILSFQPSIKTNPPYRQRKSGVPETIYTRLRNEVGHIRPNTTIEQTRQEMEKNLNGLILIVKELINHQT
ncbi:MAG: hypothetical protein EAZ76_11110 [Nostocales cyanobacterium]|nr:MAG: hypothetical protein EAZ87_07530 [Nostocales cyanobacterium]TAF13693.1 MAG: hypothetical protein EAZ76_11110 [Nostocales cyanobacterium]